MFKVMQDFGSIEGLHDKPTIGSSIIAYTILGVPHYTYSIMGPKALFQLLRPLHHGNSGWTVLSTSLLDISESQLVGAGASGHFRSGPRPAASPKRVFPWFLLQGNITA